MQNSKIKNTRLASRAKQAIQNSKIHNQNKIKTYEKVVLVDEQDREIGEMEKMEAHRKGTLHRAFSVVVFNDKEEMLLQKRNKKKYHSGGLWTNTCCGHPRPGEGIIEAGERRLFEEMGIKVGAIHELPLLKEAFTFIYKKDFGNGLWENEFDHVLVGKYEGQEIKEDQEEVDEWKWINTRELKRLIKEKPEEFTYWFIKIFTKLKSQKSKLKLKTQK